MKSISYASVLWRPATTPRRERDEVEILSGLFNGKTTERLCGMINSDTRSSDYNSDLPRPGTADLTAI